MAEAAERTVTIQDLYRWYPHGDLLPRYETYEEIVANWREVGDTLFVFLTLELCGPGDIIDLEEARERVLSAIDDLAEVVERIDDTAYEESKDELSGD